MYRFLKLFPVFAQDSLDFQRQPKEGSSTQTQQKNNALTDSGLCQKKNLPNRQVKSLRTSSPDDHQSNAPFIKDGECGTLMDSTAIADR